MIDLGVRFGTYEITALIGVGGMGEVYHARDTTLGRSAAIKVLPASFAADAARVARFEQEAKTLAALNHANIAQIFGLERSGGTLALAMELVEGTTLAERIAQGPLPVDEALGVANQIAAALEAAHTRGIVHRDLKPANVKLTPDGTVKLLDFGIAKALDARVTGGPQAPALTTPAMTEAGIVLGTAAYMSPEQARAKPVDQRADIWAFGCVLYEMLTGQLAFGGEDVTIVLARVLERPADLSALPKSTPPAVRRTLEHCFEKDPRQRIADIRDVRLLLAGRLGGDIPSGMAEPPTSRWRALPLAAAALVAGAALAGAVTWTLKPLPPSASSPVARFVHDLPQDVAFRNVDRRVIAISPDGQRFVYNAFGGLRLRAMGEFESIVVSGTEDPLINKPVFSPDGEWIAYYAQGQLRRIPVAGGASVTLAPSLENGFELHWTPDGSILFTQPNGIYELPEVGREPRRLLELDVGSAGSAQRLPGGDWILYSMVRTDERLDAREIFVVSPSLGDRRALPVRGSSARYLPTGHLVFASSGVLYAVRFDVERLEVIGGPVAVIEGLRTTNTGIAQFDVSASGSLVYIPGAVGTGRLDLELAVADHGANGSAIDAEPARFVHVRASADGERLAVDTDDGAEAIVWIHEIDGSASPRRLTFDGRNRFPVWSPDGERVAFQSDQGGDMALYAQRIDGAGGAQRLTTTADGEQHIPESWSPDGKHLAFSVAKGESYSLFVLAIEDGTVTQFGNVQSIEPIGAVFSPDGRWLAYHALPPGADGFRVGGVFVEPFPATGARYQAPKVSRDFQPTWSRDGRQLFYIGTTASGQLASVEVDTSSGLSFGRPTLLPFALAAGRLSAATRAYDTLPDGRFVGPRPVGGDANLDLPLREVRVVTNWFTELERLVPAP